MKFTSLLFILVIISSCNAVYRPLEKAVNDRLFENDFHVKYSVERIIDTGIDIISDTIVHDGNYYFINKKRYGSNERAYYIKDTSRFMMITRYQPLFVTLMSNKSQMTTETDPFYDLYDIVNLIKENSNKNNLNFSEDSISFRYSISLKNLRRRLDSLTVSIDKQNKLIRSFTFKSLMYSAEYRKPQSISDKISILKYNTDSIFFDEKLLDIDSYLKVDTIKDRIFNLPGW